MEIEDDLEQAAEAALLERASAPTLRDLREAAKGLLVNIEPAPKQGELEEQEPRTHTSATDCHGESITSV